MRSYVVKQGDYLTKLAFTMGFIAADVWGDPKNADLKAARPDPDVLAPGDVLYIPDASPEALGVEGGTSNAYAAAVPQVTVCVVLTDGTAPLANEPYVLEGNGDPIVSATGDDGAVSITAPVTLREVTITLSQRGLLYAVRIGDLDPVTEPSGVRQRLQHLGFEGYEPWTKATAAPAGEDAERDRRAIAELQRSLGLPETGEADDATRQALVKAHGS